MISLTTLKNTSLKRKAVKRVGRGPGSGKGKTCGRGEKGAGARAGYKTRQGYEGGQFRTFMKLPIRGFSNAPFRKPRYDAINLEQINFLYEDGEIVNAQTLAEKGFISGRCAGIKILGNGELTKKVSIEANTLSKTAREKLHQAKIDVKLLDEEKLSA
jgi:large subunit ribosomal protein L15